MKDSVRSTFSQNVLSVPREAKLSFDWSPDFEHACVNWRGHDVADLVCIRPNWYIVANHAFLRFRSESAARAHVARAIARVESRLR